MIVAGTGASSGAMTPALPGGTGLTHVKVYDREAPDGRRSSSPHVHLACTELYYVLGGSGAIEFLTMRGYERVPVGPGRGAARNRRLRAAGLDRRSATA